MKRPGCFDENNIFSHPCKICNCKLIKGVNEVYGRFHVRLICRSCLSKNNKAKYEKERISGLPRNKQLKKKFGITLEKYNEILLQQNGKCDICGKLREKYKKDFSVDHNHKTNKIRALICQDCNLILGNANDSIEILQKCIDYLRKHEEIKSEPNFPHHDIIIYG